jgi:hypothetical protein
MVSAFNWFVKEYCPEIAPEEDFYAIVLQTPAIIKKHHPDTDWFGSVFLCKEKLTYGRIAHECLHLALRNDWKVVGYNGNYLIGPTNNDPEERLTYKLESYIASVIKVCKEEKIRIKAYEEEEL